MTHRRRCELHRLTRAYLKRRLFYCPGTGSFFWKLKSGNDRITNAWNSRCAGKRAGSISGSGYIQITIDGFVLEAHRLAVFYMTGKWPSDETDHKNMKRADNRWSNLRVATCSQNKANRRKLKNNTSGVKGVAYSTRDKLWIATGCVRGKQSNRHFRRKADAVAWRQAQFKKHFGEFART